MKEEKNNKSDRRGYILHPDYFSWYVYRLLHLVTTIAPDFIFIILYMVDIAALNYYLFQHLGVSSSLKVIFQT